MIKNNNYYVFTSVNFPITYMCVDKNGRHPLYTSSTIIIYQTRNPVRYGNHRLVTLFILKNLFITIIFVDLIVFRSHIVYSYLFKTVIFNAKFTHVKK